MDHHGFLTLLRYLDAEIKGAYVERSTTPPKWEWNAIPVIFPETKCPYCLEVIRSPGIWFLDGERYRKIVGFLRPVSGKRVCLVQPSHPHDTGGGFLCLGGNPTGIALLASTPNLDDCPMGRKGVPRWLKMYWNHVCQPAKNSLMVQGHTEELEEIEEI